MSGRAKDASAHDEGCSCTRCTGFQPGHQLATKHGSYAVVSLAPRVAEIAERIREVVPARSPADDLAIDGLALVTARIEKAAAAVAQVDEAAAEPPGAYTGKAGETIAELRADLRRWLGLSLKYCDALGRQTSIGAHCEP